MASSSTQTKSTCWSSAYWVFNSYKLAFKLQWQGSWTWSHVPKVCDLQLWVIVCHFDFNKGLMHVWGSNPIQPSISNESWRKRTNVPNPWGGLHDYVSNTRFHAHLIGMTELVLERWIKLGFEAWKYLIKIINWTHFWINYGEKKM